ncbi:hypothetical protein BT96DRAFT_150585 [Gymnopus androsaceus JB14]|uniref:Uncharacterized protein n=1 Tax=Gymnopus androsaceus JB14 TaxID=1447944 RepID=A0A6A4I9D1_9AGAR|nr:hypothetical protein BT96DRAFT_150585 [Gymnopus androsaceus JB14]
MVLFLALIISFLSLQAVRSAGNIACADSGLDWYTNAVGETPCQTYEQLRQICNPKFAVGVMNSSLPPDVCDDPESSCCCNSVAFGLSMLCLNCQKGTEPTGVSVDATPGTYGKYLGGIKTNGSCTPVVNQTLPTNVQTSICDTRLKILDPLYARLYWSDGSWFYGYSSNLLISNISATDGNDFTRCASTTINVTFSAALPSSSTVFPSSLPSTSASSNASVISIYQSLSRRDSRHCRRCYTSNYRSGTSTVVFVSEVEDKSG